MSYMTYHLSLNVTDLIDASSPALVIVERDAAQDERDEKDDVRR